MYYADSHMHSIVSPDSDTPRADMAEAALKRGLSEICFTDHYDILDFDGNYAPYYDWAPARQQQQLALERWGDQIRIGYGLELGNVPVDFAASDRALQEPGLDMVICSVHNLSLDAQGLDFYEVHYNSPELCYAHLDNYFASMQRSVAWGNFDVLGHVPYPLRYMRQRDGQDVSLERYTPLIRHILRQIVEKGKAVEVNTKGWCPALEQDYLRLISDYHDLGGELVTVGCDAHAPEDVGAYLPRVYEMLRMVGFRYVTVYRERQPHPIPLA
jgi:histidinol-phosphatase (PHP family)